MFITFSLIMFNDRASGYQMTFGIIYIDRPSLQRIEKNSLRYYSDIITTYAGKKH